MEILSAIIYGRVLKPDAKHHHYYSHIWTNEPYTPKCDKLLLEGVGNATVGGTTRDTGLYGEGFVIGSRGGWTWFVPALARWGPSGGNPDPHASVRSATILPTSVVPPDSGIPREFEGL